MAWVVEYTDEFERWWDTLNVNQQVAIDATVHLLEILGTETISILKWHTSIKA